MTCPVTNKMIKLITTTILCGVFYISMGQNTLSNNENANMKRLFLTSSFSSVAKLFEDFAGEPVKGKKLAFIPTASLVEKVRFYVDDDRKAFEKLGLIIEELEVSTATTEEIATALERNNYIFISGGNTFYLII